MSEFSEKLKESVGRVRWRWDSLGDDGQKKAKLIGAGAVGGVAVLILVFTQVLPSVFGSSGGGRTRVADPTAFADLDYLGSRTLQELETELTQRRERLNRLIAEQGEGGEYVAAARRAVERIEQAISMHGGPSSAGSSGGRR